VLEQEDGPAVDEQRAYPGRDLDDLPRAGAFAVRRAGVVDGQCAQQVINGVPARSQRADAVQPQEEAIGSGQVQANGGQCSDNAVLRPAVTGKPDAVGIGNRAGGRLVEQINLREAPECDHRIAMTVGEVAAHHREPRIRTGCGMLAQEARCHRLDRVHSDAGTCGNRKAGTRVVRRVRHARIDEQLMSSGPARHREALGSKRLEQPLGEEAGAGATGVIVWQQLGHTPWGLPGHRGVFWLSALIASRWIIDRPGAAIRIAATSSCLILVIAPATGGQVVPYLVAALLIDRAAATQAIRRHPWLLLPLAPLINLAGVLSPFVHNLGISPLGTVLPGMWFYIQGHLLWGAAAGVGGLAVGISGHKLMRRIDPSGCGPT
jgi:hypothetical protein